MEVTLASSFPGSGDGVLLPTSRQAAMELTVCGSGRRAACERLPREQLSLTL